MLASVQLNDCIRYKSTKLAGLSEIYKYNKATTMDKKATPANSTEQLYADFRVKLDSFDPKQNPPPIITDFFSPLRLKCYENLQELLKSEDQATKTKELAHFVKVVYFEALPEFKKKIKDQYMLSILDRDYNIPSKVDTNEAKHMKITEEVCQLAEHVADWSIELEMLTELLCCIDSLGVVTLEKEKEDYLKAFRKDFAPQKVSSVRNTVDFLLKRIIGYILERTTHIAIIKGINRMQFTAPILMDIIYHITCLRVIPWRLILGFINVPWLIGTFAFYIALSEIEKYVEKEDVRANISQCDGIIVANKLYMAETRYTLLQQLVDMLQARDESVNEAKQKQIEDGLNSLLAPEKVRAAILEEELRTQDEEKISERLLNYKELEDYVVIDNFTYKELENEDGFTIVSKI